jgi:hypothetical protein
MTSIILQENKLNIHFTFCLRNVPSITDLVNLDEYTMQNIILLSTKFFLVTNLRREVSVYIKASPG